MKNKLKKFKKSGKYLPISCLCSIYINTTFEEISLALKSLLIQEYLPKQIVIVIDGPIKKKIDLLINSLIYQYEIFKIVRNRENLGLGLALRKGLKYCEYDIVARFDSDDINLKNRLEKQYRYLAENKNIDVLGTYVKEFKTTHNRKYSRLKRVPESDLKIKSIIYFRNPINHPTTMFRKESVLRSGSYISMNYFEDYYLWLRCKYNKCIFHNLDFESVAMKREDNLDRRYGLRYGYYECRFFFLCFLKGLVPIYFFMILILRFGLRVTPRIFSNMFYNYDKNRSNFNKDDSLNEYIKELNKFNFEYENY